MLQTDAAAERAGAETTDEDDEEEGPRLPYDEIQEDLFYEGELLARGFQNES